MVCDGWTVDVEREQMLSDLVAGEQFAAMFLGIGSEDVGSTETSDIGATKTSGTGMNETVDSEVNETEDTGVTEVTLLRVSSVT